MEKLDTEILVSESWLYFKLYKNPKETSEWKSNLDWYHKVLREIVKPFVDGTEETRIVLFGFYGPRPYDIENGNEYERTIITPSDDVVYIRLRLYVGQVFKQRVREELETRLQSHNDMVWDYEILKGFKARDDLGGRFGRRSDGFIDDKLTLRFIRYWDSACRYILSVLVDQENWERNVDVWGIPHLVNNSLGAWLRLQNVKCPKCTASMYMVTSVTPLPPSLVAALRHMKQTPIFLVVCPRCGIAMVISTNI